MKNLVALSTQEPLDGVAWNGIEEEQDEKGDGENDKDLQDGPLVVVPHDVADRLERVQQPHERRVRAAVTKVNKSYSVNSN